jgi:hypothetical protein
MERLWYESNAAGAVGFHFGGGLATEVSYTAYTSPNEMFSTAKEVGIRVSLDDSLSSIPRRLNPYGAIAFELDSGAGEGLDGGLHKGTYLEIGAVPEILRARRVTVEAPVKVGLSLSNYYELATRDNRFGFISAAAIASLPLARVRGLGTWTVRGGAEYQRLGTTPKAFNGGDRSEIVWRFGVALGGW